MNRYFDELARFERDDFIVVVDKTWEDVQVRDCFDDSCYDIDEMCAKIDRYDLDWFMLRTRVFFEGVELACEYLGGCLYEDAKEVMNDGMAEDQIYQALLHAKVEAANMKKKFAQLDETVIDELCV